jgi:hypothetical protein
LFDTTIFDHTSTIISTVHSSRHKSYTKYLTTPHKTPESISPATMHFFATLNALVLGATLAHAAAIPASLSASAPLQRRNGCYSAGELKSKFLKFSDLHGSKSTPNSEVSLDITSTCSMAAGHILKPGEVWTRCSEWAATTSGDCLGDCIDSCTSTSTFPGSTALADQMSAGICTASCPSRCSGVVDKVESTGTNRIDWAIKNEGSADATIDFQKCSDALNTEVGGCDSGSEQSHDGFWYRIDPNEGKCSA